VQLATVRFLGTFLADPTEVPEVAVRYVAGQLGINDPRCLDGYASARARWEHVSEIKRRYSYRDFHDRREYVGLVRWLFERAWPGGDRPVGSGNGYDVGGTIFALDDTEVRSHACRIGIDQT
jgi:hypothetical protein